jgi:DNA repair protein RadC
LPDYELLELFLFRSIPQRDVKPLAKTLLAQFGSLSAVLAATEAELTRVEVLDARGRKLKVGVETALDLRLLHEATKRITRGETRDRPVISSWTALLAYVRVALAHEAREQFRVLFLDRKNQLILDEVMNQGTVDHAPVYPREIMRRALELSASAVILVHNHPSGDPTPSRADIDMTKQVVDAGRPLKIQVHDHLVVGRDGVASFKALGLF